jgi:RHS repeat-associated protein
VVDECEQSGLWVVGEVLCSGGVCGARIGELFYIHTDHLNAPRKVQQPVTDALAWRWDTDPFGTATPNENPSGLGTFVYNLRFPGQYYDAETGLSQNWNRDYDPVVGRYLESDPIGLAAGVDTYTYVRAKAVNRIDIDDPGPGAVTLSPSQVLSGRIDLGRRFPGLRDALQRSDVILFWSYETELSNEAKTNRVNGAVVIARTPK